MTHKDIYNAAKQAAKEHRRLTDILGSIEVKKYGFEFANTDSDKIIDAINYGTDDYSFEDYEKEMKFYKKALKQTGHIKGNGIY